MMVREREEITHKAYARVGLLGNPSDVYYGKTISFSVANFCATVTLRASPELVIQPHPVHDLVHFSSLPQLVTRLNSEGYYGGVRLLMAICKVFYAYCKDNAIELSDDNFTLSYDTNIPRQARSLILEFPFTSFAHRVLFLISSGWSLGIQRDCVCGVELFAGFLQCQGAREGGDQAQPRTRRRERTRDCRWSSGSGSAGLRWTRLHGSKENMDELGHGIYIPMDLSLLPPLYLIYAENPSDSGKVHSKVRERWLDGDEFIVSSIKEVANIAEEGKYVLEEKDYSKFATLMNRNFDIRRSMFGDEALGGLNIKMVEVARKVGAASKFTGSGGAVVVFCPEGISQVKLLQDECQKEGFVILPIEPFPSRLSEIELKTLQTK
ncbi:hypothetical protein V8G54_013272 [Vigna mungo]|uniref:Glucuronokinase 1 n=1 Tax=Vigna mungo TaxID=3915 RepID=A0AAQ3S4P3_VIGMU